MRHSIIIGLAVIVVVIAGAILTPSAAQQDIPDQTQEQRDKLSYGVGYYLGREVREGLTADGIDANALLLIDGFQDGYNEGPADIPTRELDEILYAVHRELQARMARQLLETNPAFRQLSDRNMAESRASLERFAQGEGVIALDNGILYRVIKSGTGRSPTLDDTVVASYRGTLADDTVFGEGDRRESPLSTITEGGRIVLQMMHEGDHWEVLLPPELAYGAAGDPPLIGPNQALRFDVTLHEVK